MAQCGNEDRRRSTVPYPRSNALGNTRSTVYFRDANKRLSDRWWKRNDGTASGGKNYNVEENVDDDDDDPPEDDDYDDESDPRGKTMTANLQRDTGRTDTRQISLINLPIAAYNEKGIY